MEVGIRELKEHLSKYLAMVRAGQSVVITDRGVPVAHIEPATADQPPPEPLRRLMESGRAKYKGRARPLPPPLEMLPGDKDSTDFVREQRR